jgi:hypothetical protein
MVICSTPGTTVSSRGEIAARAARLRQKNLGVLDKAALQRTRHQQQVVWQLGRQGRACRRDGDGRPRLRMQEAKGQGSPAAHRVAQDGDPLRIAVAAGQRLRQRRLDRPLEDASLFRSLR